MSESVPRTILITGATGQVSGAVIEALEGTDHRLRALVRDPSNGHDLGSGGVDVHVGDLSDPRSLAFAFEGVSDLWLLTPNDPRAPEHSMNAVWAAQQAGVERVVRMSAVGASHDAPTRSGRLHALSDDELRHSEMSWTVLRPHWFMQNLLGASEHIASTGELRLNMGAGRLGMIDVRDIGTFAAHVLTSDSERYHARTFTPTGPKAISFDEVADHLGRATDREIRYRPVSAETAQQTMLDSGAPPWIAHMVIEYAQAHASGWGDFTTSDFEDVTGRPPRSIADFARDHAEAFGAGKRAEAGTAAPVSAEPSVGPGG